jgi:hypothetical protein
LDYKDSTNDNLIIDATNLISYKDVGIDEIQDIYGEIIIIDNDINPNYKVTNALVDYRDPGMIS